MRHVRDGSLRPRRAVDVPATARPDPPPARSASRLVPAAYAGPTCYVVDGELPGIPYPIIPGHEVVGRIDAIGAGVDEAEAGHAWRCSPPPPGSASTCGQCFYCRADKENLCDRPKFTGYTRDGGFASHLVADARFCFPLGERGDDAALSPLLCAGLIGWRSLAMAGDGKTLGIYGFGAAGHIVAQVARAQGGPSTPSPVATTRTQATCAFPRHRLGRRLGGHSADRARCRHHLRTGRGISAACLALGAQGRARCVRRHSHVRRSDVPLPYSLG